jgi:flagellar basal body P-ring formation protein FlgA
VSWRNGLIQGLLLGCLALSATAESKPQLLTQERVAQTLQRYILEHSAWRSDQVEVDLHSFSPLAVPEGEIGIVVLKPNLGVTPGRHSFLLGVQVNGREEARVWVDTDVKVFTEVVVTSQPLAHLEPIAPEKVRLERRDLGETPLQPVTSTEELEGKLAARSISVNQVLTTSMVDLPRVMRRGSAVALVYESAGIRVETLGRAVEPGRVGDRIRVENADSGKVIEGQILDERTVRVN